MATYEKYATADGNRWMIRYRTPDGKQTKKRGFTTKKAAEAYAAKLETSKLDGLYVAPAAGRSTVGELGDSWLKSRKATLKPSSYRNQESVYRCHIKPKWSGWPVAKISTTDVRDWVADITDTAGAQTTRAAHSILARVLDEAVEDRRIAKNPARSKTIRLPKPKPRKRMRYLTPEQVEQLAAESINPEVVLLLCYTGLRWGEFAALRVRDIDLDRCRLSVHENAVWVSSTVHVGTLKGGEARTVPFPASLVPMIAPNLAGKAPDALAWERRTGGHMSLPSERGWLGGAVRRCIASTELTRQREISEHGEATTPPFPRVTAHDFRHTAASLAISAGANVKVLQKVLGHSSATLTLDTYADLFPDDLDAVAEALGRMRSEVVPKMCPQTPSERRKRGRNIASISAA